MTDLLALLKGVGRSGDGWTARCPAHVDGHNSLSIHHRDGRWLLKCHAGCEWQAIAAAIGLVPADLFDDEEQRKGGRRGAAYNRATVQPTAGSSRKSDDTHVPEATAPVEAGESGLTLDRYATAKGLPIDFLKSCGLSELIFDRKAAVRIPYFGDAGEELAVRFRIALDGDRFRWKSGTRPCLYGLNRLAELKKAGQGVLVEGESDCHTLWFHGLARLVFLVPAIGARSVTPDTWMGSRLSTLSWSLIVVEIRSGNGCPAQQFVIGQSCSVCQ